MTKVVREAKVLTDWANPNNEYEQACSDFIEHILKEDSPFLQSFVRFYNTIAPAASIYSVAQAVVKLTAPGIPDIYQGCELLDLSYVDPDNRRPVDYRKRIDFLRRLQVAESAGWNELSKFLDEFEDCGIKKMFATWKCLQLRKQHPTLFSEGVYVPLTLTGHGGLVVSFARYVGQTWCVVLIPFGLGGKNKLEPTDFNDIFISLPANSPRQWRNIFTNEPIVIDDTLISVRDLIRSFPVAVLCSQSEA
jgi:(1->4)-alpha-D-glucan 1-alpha-D-glucosylmutase